MGGLTSLASTAIQILGAANSVVGTLEDYQSRSGNRAYDQLKEQSDLALQNAAEQAALQKEQIRLTAEQAESERRSALRRAVARQRAQFGASGVGSSGGSSQAVLLGLFDESDEDRRQREALDSLKTNAVDQGYAQQSRINILQLTQLKERDRLKRVGSALGGLKDAGSIIFS